MTQKKFHLSMEMERITSAVDCVKCVPIPVIKQDDPPLWVAEN